MKPSKLIIISVFFMIISSCKNDTPKNTNSIEQGAALPDYTPPNTTSTTNQNMSIYVRNYSGDEITPTQTGPLELEFYAENTDEPSDISYNLTQLPVGAEYILKDGTTPSLYWANPVVGQHQATISASSIKNNSIIASKTITINISDAPSEKVQKILSYLGIVDLLTGKNYSTQAESLLTTGAGNGLNLDQVLSDLNSENMSPIQLITTLLSNQN